jgi:hypothetical protein
MLGVDNHFGLIICVWDTSQFTHVKQYSKERSRLGQLLSPPTRSCTNKCINVNTKNLKAALNKVNQESCSKKQKKKGKESKEEVVSSTIKAKLTS